VMAGLDAGVKRLSEINMGLAAVLLLFVIVVGPTVELITGFFSGLYAYGRELVPLVLAHEIDNVELIVNSLIGFVAFCLCASSVYLLNDMLDLDADRQHPTKCSRPFAAGELAISAGVIAMGALLLASLVLALLLPPYFLPVLGIYYLTTLAYSVWLKRAALLDGLVLAGLYTLRLIAGAAAIGVQPSFWLLAFSVFIFLSLAFIKRYSELLLLHANSDDKIAGRGYKAVDMETLAQLGTASGYLAVLVLALYINGDKVEQMYPPRRYARRSGRIRDPRYAHLVAGAGCGRSIAVIRVLAARAALPAVAGLIHVGLRVRVVGPIPAH